MKSKNMLLPFFCSISLTVFSQNFTISPEKPQAGDMVTITYEPAGNLAGTVAPVEAVAYELNDKNQKAIEVKMTRSYGKFKGSFQTDTSECFLYFTFSADNKTDNNFNKGYWSLLYDGNEVKKGAYAQLSSFYRYYIERTGGEVNLSEALTALEKELSLHPESRTDLAYVYISLLRREKPAEAITFLQKEVEAKMKVGLKTEKDYDYVMNLFNFSRLPQQAQFFLQLKKEKFPTGEWRVDNDIVDYNMERSPAKKEILLAELLKKIETDPAYSSQQKNISGFRTGYLMSFIYEKDWQGFHKAVEAMPVTDSVKFAAAYNDAAWTLLENNADLLLAEKISRFAAERGRMQWKTPSVAKPQQMTQKQWDDYRKENYSMYADTYGMVLYKLGQYKKGFAYAKDAAITMNEGKSADMNYTYALLAEKVLSAKAYKKQLEEFVKNDKANTGIMELLKKNYQKGKKDITGFDQYVATLKEESHRKMFAQLKGSMLNQQTPGFALLNLDGKKIDIAELKGKVVVVDFWATWCGPCKASFPAMQTTLDKYKDNADVKFVFIDTWERADEKEKNAKDFIAKNKYSFDVLMDNENSVVEKFRVDGIPTKFVIGKDGKIRFKAVGFDGNNDKLVEELSAMIELAAEPVQ